MWCIGVRRLKRDRQEATEELTWKTSNYGNSTGLKLSPLGSNNQLESEELLEETLVANPKLLLEGLTLVGRQTPTEGGPLDLLGVDEDGKLVVFELKRGTLSHDAVAQIIDYASYLDDMDLNILADHIAERSGVDGIEEIKNFQEWYESRGFGELESLKPLRMFLVGLGADDRTERMVRFLANNSGMDISLLTFHGFDYEGKTILAKQVEVEAAAEPERRSKRGYVSVAERKASLERTIEESGVAGLYEEVKAMFMENWPQLREEPGSYGLSLRLRNPIGPMAYARIDPRNEGVWAVFYPQSIELCLDEFSQLVKNKIPFQTWPKNRKPLEDPNAEIQFRLTLEEWEIHNESLTALVRSIYEAWENKVADDGADSV